MSTKDPDLIKWLNNKLALAKKEVKLREDRLREAQEALARAEGQVKHYQDWLDREQEESHE